MTQDLETEIVELDPESHRFYLAVSRRVGRPVHAVMSEALTMLATRQQPTPPAPSTPAPVPPRPRGRTVVTEAEVEQIRKGNAAGLSDLEIARHLNRPQSTVSQIRRKHLGLPVNR